MTNEPTTGEIVRALRCVAEATECKDCRYKYPVGNVILCDHEQMNGNAADRLESQEQENASLRAENEGLYKEIIRRGIEIKTVTARAESAERERDSLINSIERLRTKKIELCSICEFEDMIGCAHKNHCTGYQNFKRRGLPQDGEEK